MPDDFRQSGGSPWGAPPGGIRQVTEAAPAARVLVRSHSVPSTATTTGCAAWAGTTAAPRARTTPAPTDRIRPAPMDDELRMIIVYYTA